MALTRLENYIKNISIATTTNNTTTTTISSNENK